MPFCAPPGVRGRQRRRLGHGVHGLRQGPLCARPLPLFTPPTAPAGPCQGCTVPTHCGRQHLSIALNLLFSLFIFFLLQFFFSLSRFLEFEDTCVSFSGLFSLTQKVAWFQNFALTAVVPQAVYVVCAAAVDYYINF